MLPPIIDLVRNFAHLSAKLDTLAGTCYLPTQLKDNVMLLVMRWKENQTDEYGNACYAPTK